MNSKTTLLMAQDSWNRRAFLRRTGAALGLTALHSLLGGDGAAIAAPAGGAQAPQPATTRPFPNFRPRAKRVIYLFQSGAPSQIDLFDPKPGLEKHRGEDLPASIRMGQRITTMTSGQKTLPVAPTVFRFAPHGQSGTLLSELLPHTAQITDELCVIRTLFTEAINHDPAITFFQTGGQIAGRPSIGSWLAYGLGSPNHDLPAYVVLTSRGSGRKEDQPLYERLWGSGFLPTEFAGIRFRRGADPVPFLADPPGLGRQNRRSILDDVAALNGLQREVTHDPEISARIAQYEMAFRMQTSVPDLIDLSGEPSHVLDSYGPEVRTPGTYAYNCLIARRLAERGVPFVQLFHTGWDQHDNCPRDIRGQCRDTDQPSAALVLDLKARGLLDDTLVIWGGEFGRTIYSQGTLTAENYGRDHHPRCFTVWMAGGGVRPGLTYGTTDDYCYNIVENPVHVHDFHATILHLLGIDHTQLVYKFQGRWFRLTDVHGNIVQALLA